MNKVVSLPRGVTEVRDGRHEAKPFCVRHRDRPREFFATAELAVARKRELLELERRHGAEALDYDRAVHAQVVEARAMLPAGVSIVDAARFWADHHPSGESPSVAAAVPEFLAAKTGGAGERHARDLRSRMRAFTLAFGERTVAEVGSEALLAWLRALDHSPRTIANYRGAVQNFFNFAVRRGWCGRSPMERIAVGDLPRVPGSAKHPLSVGQAERLLEVVAAERPEYLAHFALRLFLGFRTAEARRFRWEWIQPEQGRVYIPAHASKTADAWSIDDVPPRFWRLVDPPVRNGRVPAPYTRAWEGSRAIKGQRTRRRGLKAKILEAIDRTNWPDNATRDTFCTLHISAYRDPQRTALMLKHRSSQTLWQSYLGTLIPAEEAKPFFEGWASF